MDWLVANGHDVIPGEVSAWGSSDRVRGSTDLLVFQYSASSGFSPSLSSGKRSVLLEAPFFDMPGQVKISASAVFGASMEPMGEFLRTKTFPPHALLSGVRLESMKVDKTGPVLLLDIPNPAAQDWAIGIIHGMNIDDRMIKIRQHPISISDADRRNRESLTDAVRSASLVICYSSTALSECVRLGAPFICSTDCLYWPMQGAKPRPENERRKFINGLLSCDFGLTDIQCGDMHRRVMQLAGL
jgi:hypothetical protein